MALSVCLELRTFRTRVLQSGITWFVFAMGRQAAVSAARADSRVPEPVKKLSVGKDSQNMVIEGDSLQALASLKSRYAGEVDVIYIDRPYNLGRG